MTDKINRYSATCGRTESYLNRVVTLLYYSPKNVPHTLYPTEISAVYTLPTSGQSYSASMAALDIKVDYLFSRFFRLKTQSYQSFTPPKQPKSGPLSRYI